MFYKRGQAAMEFLMTYGWAILAAIVVIAVLAAFGVFSPSKYVPAACVINAPWGCEEYKVNSTGVHLALRNGGGEDLNITALTVRAKQPSGAVCTATAPNVTVINGALSFAANETYNGCTGLSSGSKFSGEITVMYKKIGGTFDMVSTGSITQSITTA